MTLSVSPVSTFFNLMKRHPIATAGSVIVAVALLVLWRNFPQSSPVDKTPPQQPLPSTPASNTPYIWKITNLTGNTWEKVTLTVQFVLQSTGSRRNNFIAQSFTLDTKTPPNQVLTVVKTDLPKHLQQDGVRIGNINEIHVTDASKNKITVIFTMREHPQVDIPLICTATRDGAEGQIFGYATETPRA